MKNIITCFLILAALHGYAQQDELEVIPKGTKFIGGNLSLNLLGGATTFPDTDDKNKTKAASFSLGPVIGKYTRDNVSLGLSASYSYSINKSEYLDGTENESSFNSGGVFLFIRKNYKIVPNIFFFLQADVGGLFGVVKNIDYSDNEFESQSYSTSLGGSPGFQLFLGKKFSLETTLGSVGYQFTHSSSDNSDAYTNSHRILLTGGFGAINFSVRYFIFP